MVRSSSRLYWTLTGVQIVMFLVAIVIAIADGHTDLLALGFLCIAFGITLFRAFFYIVLTIRVRKAQKGS